MKGEEEINRQRGGGVGLVFVHERAPVCERVCVCVCDTAPSFTLQSPTPVPTTLRCRSWNEHCPRRTVKGRSPPMVQQKTT